MTRILAVSNLSLTICWEQLARLILRSLLYSCCIRGLQRKAVQGCAEGWTKIKANNNGRSADLQVLQMRSRIHGCWLAKEWERRILFRVSRVPYRMVQGGRRIACRRNQWGLKLILDLDNCLFFLLRCRSWYVRRRDRITKKRFSNLPDNHSNEKAAAI